MIMNLPPMKRPRVTMPNFVKVKYLNAKLPLFKPDWNKVANQRELKAKLSGQTLGIAKSEDVGTAQWIKQSRKSAKKVQIELRERREKEAGGT